MLLSIVSPVYKAEKIVDELVKRIHKAVSEITQDYEIILVEDGGGDESWEKIEKHSSLDKRVKGIKLSRNFGQHNAITAGLDKCIGDWVVVMDCDLQDRPEEIERLYKKALEGYDIVMAQREERKDKFFKLLMSNIFYHLFSYFTGFKHEKTVANFGIYKNSVIKVVTKMREPIRSFSLMVRWVGFKKIYVPVEHNQRFEGKSSYNWRQLIRFAFDIIISYSDKPLKLIIKIGFIISIISFFISVYYLLRFLFIGISVQGYTSIIISIWFLGGLIIFILGTIGLYLSKTFDAIKNRPLYVISEIKNI